MIPDGPTQTLTHTIKHAGELFSRQEGYFRGVHLGIPSKSGDKAVGDGWNDINLVTTNIKFLFRECEEK